MTARTRRPNTVAAGTVSSQIRRLYTFSLLPSTVTCFTLGTASLRTSRRFWLNSNPYRVVPVTLPPGRERLWTIPLSTRSPAVATTIGIVFVARFAAINEIGRELVEDLGPA